MGTFLYAALGDSSGIGFGACDGHGYVSRTFARLSRMMPRAELMNLCHHDGGLTRPSE